LFCSYIYPSRHALFGAVAVVAVLSLPIGAGLTLAQGTDPLPSWNDGPAKQAIVDFVKTTTDKAGADFVPSEERIATFDQDGTLWVEHPIYSQVIYCLERVSRRSLRTTRSSRRSSLSRRSFRATRKRSPSCR
jgi:hypothetical protein